ncbi:nitrate reductase [Variibacter gotjawalensis]|uniref:Nitrate reductase n=1 Tax=Variibacter gotjawalensis TaxID=1333996 RepID=A0A0S3PNM3_9BRAD|nr:nitrate reductase [Variibacter gotjawalensis]NIK47797.1 assimilatory nitrate reductase catalytic subunit [Variibacter gotjawalensis]RZS49684.1 assimilatory nitrate reductase (NADH) alpha subunit apoprotein [Variibacter gotjawalensis]BAT57513.1 nitrate reductase [Variibacter gotjawalensis]
MNAPLAHSPAVRTTCPYCGVGCGVLAKPDGAGGAAVTGDPGHPANFGRLCSKGSALGETLTLHDRLLYPMMRDGGGALARASWDAALDRVADGFKRIVAQHGPNAVAFYLSGQLLTEDYYVANKLMKGFIGSANVDTNSRLCMASSVAGHKRAFGADTVPGNYEDLDQADLLVLTGSNTAWCHPVLFQRMLANKRERGARIVVIDPRRTATADEADLFLPIAPGMDTVLFSGLLTYLADVAAVNWNYVTEHTAGFDDALARAREIAPDLPTVATKTGLTESDIARFYAWFAGTRRAVTCYSQGVNQSAQGTDKVGAIINCHLATGRIGLPGAGPFSLTGQPNAMGGREVGGLANQLAAHMGFSPEEVDRVGRFWQAPHMATHEGLKAVDMFDAIARGEIKALWVMGTNPAVSLPRAAAVREALSELELFVVSENVHANDTVSAKPHVLLPAAAWGERDGTVTNSERRISRQRSFLPLPGESKPDWWAVSEVAKRLGHGEAFAYRSAAEIFREHAALSAFENEGTRDFDIGGLDTLDDRAYARLAPIQWPVRDDASQTARFFADGKFFTPDRKAKFAMPAEPALADRLGDAFPLWLNTGRIRDQWHTMTRTGRSQRLGGHLPEAFVEIHPEDAARFGIVNGEYARIATAHGKCVLKAVVTTAQQRGMLFAPIHWSDATAGLARVGDMVIAATDPYSGQPESKATAATIAPVSFRWRGFALTRTPFAPPVDVPYARVAATGGYGLLFASDESPETWRQRAERIFANAECAEYLDAPGEQYRVAAFVDGRLAGALFVAPFHAAPEWDAVKTLFEAEAVSADARRALLSGRSADGAGSCGPLVCACFGVPLGVIREAIAAGAGDADAIGRAVKAGTNCGSCKPELKRILADERAPQTV